MATPCIDFSVKSSSVMLYFEPYRRHMSNSTWISHSSDAPPTDCLVLSLNGQKLCSPLFVTMETMTVIDGWIGLFHPEYRMPIVCTTQQFHPHPRMHSLYNPTIPPSPAYATTTQQFHPHPCMYGLYHPTIPSRPICLLSHKACQNKHSLIMKY